MNITDIVLILVAGLFVITVVIGVILARRKGDGEEVKLFRERVGDKIKLVPRRVGGENPALKLDPESVDIEKLLRYQLAQRLMDGSLKVSFTSPDLEFEVQGKKVTASLTEEKETSKKDIRWSRVA